MTMIYAVIYLMAFNCMKPHHAISPKAITTGIGHADTYMIMAAITALPACALDDLSLFGR